MQLVLVRHGRAGTKEGWAGDDRRRPLDARGRRQAMHIADVVAPLRPDRILSSPSDRCIQTMEPLAAELGIPIEEGADLTPNAAHGALALVRSLSTPGSSDQGSSDQGSSGQGSSDQGSSGTVVLCTHGEVIGVVLAALAAADGIRLPRRPPGLKGCVWVIEFRQGRVVSARYIAPARL
ncbi:MAG TPA: histidine phosphatase family protein [Acidimicrobiales bacterium]|nr:histidine phosphatase family protein [Acidimicrobiales bacterium]